MSLISQLRPTGIMGIYQTQDGRHCYLRDLRTGRVDITRAYFSLTSARAAQKAQENKPDPEDLQLHADIDALAALATEVLGLEQAAQHPLLKVGR